MDYIKIKYFYKIINYPKKRKLKTDFKYINFRLIINLANEA